MKAGELLGMMKGQEFHPSYPMTKLLTPPALRASYRKPNLELTVTENTSPLFDHALRADCYYYAVTVCWINTATKHCDWETRETEWEKINEGPFEYDLEFEKPLWANQFVVVMEVRGGQARTPIENFKATAMRVMDCERDGLNFLDEKVLK